MQISLEWLQDFVDLPGVDELCDLLNKAGVEVEEVADPRQQSRGIIVGQVLSCAPHPNADRLTVCEVTDGTETTSVICGAPNVVEGAKVALAPVGATLPGLGSFRFPKGFGREGCAKV